MENITTPAANQSGAATITVTVSDGSASTIGTFVLTIISVNDDPSFTKGMNQTVNEDAGQQFATNWTTHISVGPTIDEHGLLDTLDDLLLSDLAATMVSQGHST